LANGSRRIVAFNGLIRPLTQFTPGNPPLLCAALVNLLRSFGYRATVQGSAEVFLNSADLRVADCVLTDWPPPVE
jgi:hypothetical protein